MELTIFSRKLMTDSVTEVPKRNSYVLQSINECIVWAVRNFSVDSRFSREMKADNG